MTEYNGLQSYVACLTAENGFSIALRMESDKTYLRSEAVAATYIFKRHRGIQLRKEGNRSQGKKGRSSVLLMTAIR